MTFLKWAVNKININIEYWGKGSFWQSLVQVNATIFSLAVTIAFANLLPKQTLGIYNYILSIYSLLAIFTLSGMDTAIIQSIAKGKEGTVREALKSRIKWGVLGTLISFGMAIFYFYQGDTTFGYSFLIIAAFLPFFDSFAIFYDILIGKKRFDAHAKYAIGVQIITSLTIITALVLTKSLIVILLAYFASYTLSHLFFLRRTIINFPLNTEEDPTMVQYGKSMTIIKALTSTAAYLDKILLFYYLGPVQVAIYSLALAPISKINGFLATIPSLALPRFSSTDKSLIKKTMLGKVLKFSIVVIFIIAIYVLLTPLFFKLLFPQYIDSIFYSRLLALSLLGLPFTLFYTYFLSQKLTNILFPYKIIAHTIQIILLFVFIHFYGLLGAVLARIASQIILMPVIILFFKKS